MNKKLFLLTALFSSVMLINEGKCSMQDSIKIKQDTLKLHKNEIKSLCKQYTFITKENFKQWKNAYAQFRADNDNTCNYDVFFSPPQCDIQNHK